MLNLGVRAHDFGQHSADELAALVAAQGFHCVQLAPGKAITGVAPDGVVDAATAQRIGAAFVQRGLEIAVLGCYINLGVADPDGWRFGLERFRQHLRVARAFPALTVGTETGSVRADFSFHPDNRGEAAFTRVLEGVRELIRAAEAHDAVVAIEPVERYVISSPSRLRRLIDAIESPRLQVILDPVNLLSAENHHHQDEIMAEALESLGPHIAIVHAKDFVIRDGRMVETPAGAGQLHYGPLLRWIKAARPDLPVLLENTEPATVAATATRLRQLYAKA